MVNVEMPAASTLAKFPVDFVRNVKCPIPTEISLIGPSRNVWKVQLVQVENDYFFGQGWSEFVVDNHMKYEDFCVFEYVEENKCQVIIFDCSNGCESQAAFHAVPSQASSSTPAAATSKGKEKAVEDEGLA
ncbi:B3 domain-containing protein REM20-like [Papaver somniferum]|uniref:B3 domain-containing protein REM20-like n=1 Tax=Papaver somniferum TaxID=3469 RepID=UPI000E6F4BBC|nr:B3 domain-containing protein REM20-like [Papaver somniferum]